METIPLNNERVSLVNTKLLTKHQRIVALILLPYNISIIQKLKGHIKGRLISRIYQSNLTPFNIGQITDQFRPVNKLSIPTGERCEPRENLRASDSRVTSRDSPKKRACSQARIRIINAFIPKNHGMPTAKSPAFVEQPFRLLLASL